VCLTGIDGESFLRRIQESNLFGIALDGRGEWFRFHHIFRDLLKRMLEHRYSPDEIAALHARARSWFEAEGMIEEAVSHALEAGDSEGAVRMVTARRSDLMNREEWHRLRRLLARLPSESIKKEPELLMVRAWSLVGFPEIAEILDVIEGLMAADPGRYSRAGRLWGEYCVLRSLQHYGRAEGLHAVELAHEALETLPFDSLSERGFAMILLGVSLQMSGEPEKAKAALLEALRRKEASGSTWHARLLAGLCFVQWVEGDLSGLRQTAREYLRLGEETGLLESHAHAHYFLSLCHYERNELSKAERNLSKVVRDVQALYLSNRHNYVHSAFALSMTLQALGQTDEASKTAEEVAARALETSTPYLLMMARAFQAELALRQGRFAEAEKWSETYDPQPFRAAYRFYVPQLTLSKVLLAQGTPKSLKSAEELLAKLCGFFTRTHNTNFLMRSLVLDALVHDSLGEEGAAAARVSEALALAEPGGFIRPFLDLGDPMAELLGRFCEQNGGGDYVKGLLEAFRNAGTSKPAVVSSSSDSLADPLTGREIDILALLTKRLRNKEIADRLGISPETVRRHTANIYQKLDVHDRRRAVERAHSLSILPGV
jgi:LuxR family maltose regulon positive regulatory protein